VSGERAGLRLQRLLIRLHRGPGRALLRLLHLALARVYAAYLCRGEPGSSIYLRGSMAREEAIYGMSDVDLGAIVSGDHPDSARRRIRSRHERALGRLPVLALLVDPPVIYEARRLPTALTQSVLSYGLADGSSSYEGLTDEHDQMQLERPELYASAATWRLLAGAERRTAGPPVPEPSTRAVHGWLELQNWWRFAFAACDKPDRPRSSYLCVKLIAEAARIWLWISTAEHVSTRQQALARGRIELPEEAEAFERASRLYADLHHARPAPLSEFLPPFLRLSARIAEQLSAQAAPAGSVAVSLIDAAGPTFTLPHGGLPPRDRAPWSSAEPLLPLADWRALVDPIEPDETFAIVDGDPADPETIRATGLSTDRGAYATLSAHGLLLRPTPHWGRGRLRAVHCALTDPVSWALASAETVAQFPNLTGLSIGDTARRARAEHSAWLHRSEGDRSGPALARTIMAARAALLWQSLADGQPELTLTAAGTVTQLASRAPEAESIAEQAHHAYLDFAWTWEPPPPRVVDRLRRAVLALPAYDAAQSIVRSAS
jgi:hypothetical protein